MTIGEQEEMAAERIFAEGVTDATKEAVEPLRMSMGSTETKTRVAGDRPNMS